MERKNSKAGLSRSKFVRELSWRTELPQVKVKEILAAVVEIAQREARTTFILPGFCKVEVVRRKARRLRNPRTGASLVLPERDALRLTVARAFRTGVVGHVAAMTPEEYAKIEKAPETEKAPTPPPEPAPTVSPETLISFRCPRCRQEVEATGDMVGVEAECPSCGAMMKVPAVSEPGTTHGEPLNPSAPEEFHPVVTEQEAEVLDPRLLKSRTIRINASILGNDLDRVFPMISFRCPKCHQEIEASSDMIGETAECPNCQSPVKVPASSTPNTLHAATTDDPKLLGAMKSRTMRIDLHDVF